MLESPTEAGSPCVAGPRCDASGILMWEHNTIRYGIDGTEEIGMLLPILHIPNEQLRNERVNRVLAGEYQLIAFYGPMIESVRICNELNLDESTQVSNIPADTNGNDIFRNVPTITRQNVCSRVHNPLQSNESTICSMVLDGLTRLERKTFDTRHNATDASIVILGSNVQGGFALIRPNETNGTFQFVAILGNRRRRKRGCIHLFTVTVTASHFS